eukprot:CAMPEP_0197651262 /NCGR_PEP_ID=MMETSP1338-20131121/31722_1 /TAXON_ID=43686 ORGANISM="Pelagodinium beii, Strain RCC1491" /NCGR_SAMPLE_ID=MMETSP1338 /ASSEMBLY_ACC=CAM_ASM_000754 /LENGTH=40 /DNA_ID= /DNA_START= /DNA_END= /DNA_ORIENTATION=
MANGRLAKGTSQMKGLQRAESPLSSSDDQGQMGKQKFSTS